MIKRKKPTKKVPKAKPVRQLKLSFNASHESIKTSLNLARKMKEKGLIYATALKPIGAEYGKRIDVVREVAKNLRILEKKGIDIEIFVDFLLKIREQKQLFSRKKIHRQRLVNILLNRFSPQLIGDKEARYIIHLILDRIAQKFFPRPRDTNPRRW